MANRFHNKFHKYNHHTEKQDNIPDAGYDPIASHESPFLGDFVISPFEDAVLSAKLLNVERISAWGDEGIVIETSGAAMSLDESVISAHSDSISAYFDDTALLRGLSGQLRIEPKLTMLSGLDISELRTRTGSFELRDTIATLWNNDGLKVNNFAGLYFTQEKGEYRDNDWRIKSFVDVNDYNNNGIDFSYSDTDSWVSAFEIRKDGVSAMHISSESVNSETIYASEQVSATSGFFVTLSAGSIIGGEKDPMAMRIYHYGSPDIVESPDDWFGFDPVTKTITSFNYQTGRENVVIPWEIGGVAVEAIGIMAFSPDYAGRPVETLIGPKTVLLVGSSAFSSCSSLTSVSLPAATSIGDSAFIGCSLLTSVSLPAATSIGDYAFYGCGSLTSVSLPAATSIGIYTFFECDSLTSVSLSEAEAIGNYAFSYCSSLTSISLPAATVLEVGAFAHCNLLTSISLPAATSIGDYAFSYCDSLTSVYFGTAKPTEGFDMFYDVPQNQVTIYVLESIAWSGVITWCGMPVVQVEDFGLIDTEIFAKSVKIQDSLIIKDTADGNYYRIQITNGILNTELVSGV